METLNKKIVFVPTGDKLLVKPYEEEQHTVLHMVKNEKDKPKFGVVLAQGDGVMVGSLVGMKIAFPFFAGSELEMFGEKLLVISYDETFGVFREVEDDGHKPGEPCEFKK